MFANHRGHANLRASSSPARLASLWRHPTKILTDQRDAETADENLSVCPEILTSLALNARQLRPMPPVFLLRWLSMILLAVSEGLLTRVCADIPEQHATALPSYRAPIFQELTRGLYSPSFIWA